eukprot:gnl/MRDRNA2_/MRDRNA2_151420_c0_seq1.p1 gnl/MRDRNA2_/MRDRNA2_151420_c0~~gnl/MRDRNA2_/MRDRNA2_151420_c0_seq1.p1  ORF type:complete len:233 (-),score=32.11 gnl/MRDRNA2_/MRDRNA2_151420_c0_seq1:191-889(-)
MVLCCECAKGFCCLSLVTSALIFSSIQGLIGSEWVVTAVLGLAQGEEADDWAPAPVPKWRKNREDTAPPNVRVGCLLCHFFVGLYLMAMGALGVYICLGKDDDRPIDKKQHLTWLRRMWLGSIFLCIAQNWIRHGLCASWIGFIWFVFSAVEVAWAFAFNLLFGFWSFGIIDSLRDVVEADGTGREMMKPQEVRNLAARTPQRPKLEGSSSTLDRMTSSLRDGYTQVPLESR